MAYTLLEGPAGSGKTHHCLERLREAQRRGEPDSVRLLVPAQSAYNMRAALATADLPVIQGRPVLTFDARSRDASFAGWVLGGVTGGGGWVEVLSETSQLLCVRRALRGSPPRDPQLALAARTLGFSQELLRLFAEWKEALLSPEDIAGAFESGDRPDATRQQELARLYALYRDALAAEGQLDSGDLERRALDELRARPGRLAGTHFLVDSFSHFTHGQLEVLRLLARHAASLTVTFPFEERRPWVHAHLANDRALLTSGELAGARVETLQGSPRFRAPALAALERELFREKPAVHSPGPAEAVAVELFEAAGPAAELEEIARRIRVLVRDEGLAYDEIAVLFRSLSPARRRVEEIFRAHGVPAFVDDREAQLHTAPARAARHILRLHARRGEGAGSEVVLALLRSALVPGLRDAADRLELAARERGIFGAARLLEQAPALLEEGSPAAPVVRALGQLTAAGGPRPAAGWVEAIRAGLRSLGAHEARRADPRLYLRHAAAWDQLDGLLDLMAEHDGAPLELEAFESDFLELLSTGRGGEAPRYKGCVLVGDVFLSRLPEVRALFLPGLAEGTFPARPTEDSLLPDADRRRIAAHTGRALPLAAERTDEEYYFYYVAVTRASERLCLGRPTADLDGSELARSPFLEETRRVLPWLAAQRADLRGPRFEQAADGRDLDERLALEISRPRGADSPTALAVALYNARRAQGGESPWSSVPRPARLEGLERTGLDLTPTRLEDYAKCPFFHFARHELNLDAPRELAFGPREDGTLLDDVATACLRELKERGGLREAGSREALAARMRAQLERELADRHASLAERPLWKVRVEMLKAALDRFAGVLWDQLQAGEWEPGHFQLSFGGVRRTDDPASTKEPLVLRGGGVELRLKGRMDRVDCAVADPSRMRVLDYKRSGAHAIAEQLLDGRLLQASLYRLALEDTPGRTVETVGHLNFKNGKLQDFDRELGRARAAAGLPEVTPSEFVRGKALELGARLARGDVEVRPARGACELCPAAAVCRIDLWQQLLAAGGEDEVAEEGGDE